MGEKFPEVAGLVVRVEAVDDDLGFGRIVELALDAVVTRDAVMLGNVERAFIEYDSVGGLEAFEQGLHLALAAVVDDRVHLLELSCANEHGPFVAQRERTRSRETLRPHLHFEAGRHLELVDREILRGFSGHFDCERMQRGFALFRFHPLLPRRRRCGRRLVLGVRSGECEKNDSSKDLDHELLLLGIAIRTEETPASQCSCLLRRGAGSK